MKVAVFSESPADEAAMWILVSAICNTSLDRVNLPGSLRTHGWPSVRDVLPNAIRYLFYRTDAEGLVVIADSDDTDLHTAKHDEPGGYEPTCRLCELRAVRQRTLQELSGRVPGRVMRVAIALAVPSIEAWWRCGLDVHATEQSWGRQLPSGPFPYTRRDLKKAVYGTERPSLPLATLKMKEAAERLASDLSSLERHFPIGFGSFSAEFRAW